MNRKLVIAVLLALTILLGFLRDYIFVLVNSLIEAGVEQKDNLLLLKWMLTLFFSILFFVMTWAFLKVLFPARNYVRIAFGIYVGLLLVSFLLSAIAYLFLTFEAVYPFIRAIMGLLQSPIIGMFIIPACWIKERQIMAER